MPGRHTRIFLKVSGCVSLTTAHMTMDRGEKIRGSERRESGRGQKSLRGLDLDNDQVLIRFNVFACVLSYF